MKTNYITTSVLLLNLVSLGACSDPELKNSDFVTIENNDHLETAEATNLSDRELINRFVYPAYNQGINEARDLFYSQNMYPANCSLAPIFIIVDCEESSKMPFMFSKRTQVERHKNGNPYSATYEFSIRRDLLLKKGIEANEELKEMFKWVFMNLQS